MKPMTSNEAVKKKTAKAWPEWFKLMDKAKAHNLTHQQIVAWLERNHPSLSGWWQQMITVTYEQARGLRKKHQKPDGYQISVSKTFPLSVSTLYRAWKNKNRQPWLSEKLTIRKATLNKSLRITWEKDQTHVDVQLYLKDKKAKNKTQLTISHNKLKTAVQAERMKKFWAKTLEKLAAHYP